MQTALGALGFTVTAASDLGLAASRTQIAAFTKTVAAGDVALVYYSGHGIQMGGDNYIVPVDFDPAKGPKGAKDECIKIGEIQAGLEKAGPKLNISIVDACRDTPWPAVAPAKGLALMEGSLGSCIVLAAGPGQTASDNPKEKNGLFTKYLLKELAKPTVPMEEMFRRVKEQVYKESGERQRPWLLFDTIGDFYFAGEVPAQSGFDRALEAGKVEFAAGRYEEAIKLFDSAKRIRPEDAYPYNAIGAAQLQLKQTSLAVESLNAAIERKADYGAAYYNRGVAYFKAANYELAAQDFSWAVDSDPFDPRPLDLRGQAYYAMRDQEHALEDFNRALELNPSDTAAFIGRARVMIRTGKFAEAIGDLNRCIAIRPSTEAEDLRVQASRSLQRR
jgi:tetratricopeptide (TPR) repeat protein